MHVFGHISDLQGFLSAQNKIIGFVPTMGALHTGHVSLIKEAKAQSGLVVCSIFVNPTQFNDKKDLERYPRTFEADAALLREAGCDVLFAPSVEEMYPEVDTRKFDFGFLDRTLDGAFRPGHFNGVAQIVSKLFEAVKPHKAFFGQKDYQQVLVVKELVKQLKMQVEIIPCPILRDPDGLAMSSRNVLLTKEEREQAAAIPKLMQEAKAMFNGRNAAEVKKHVENRIASIPLFKPDYFEIRNAEDLSEFDPAKDRQAIALIAVFCGRIRLIDNLLLQ
ncbi:MAG: pantoate--beta-alanine ligase [Bacteroidetes bacterium]|jgi:pantoate--beta-alanine ligase|nr:pantoate--beta-alanine ligase [Bacteroidota bacterium]